MKALDAVSMPLMFEFFKQARMLYRRQCCLLQNLCIHMRRQKNGGFAITLTG